MAVDEVGYWCSVTHSQRPLAHIAVNLKDFAAPFLEAIAARQAF